MNVSNNKFVWTVALLGLSAVAMAAEPTRAPTHPQEPVGFVTGAVIGAFAGGPVGAVVGAGIGTWLGNRVHRASDATQAEARVAVLEGASVAQSALEAPMASPTPPPAPLAASASAAEVLDGLQGDVLFRTGSAEITPEIAHQVQVLAQAVSKSTALKVRIDGYADPRGSDALNMQLSQARASAVRDLLLAAGVPAQVVQLNAYGKTQSVAQDDDGFALERRVRVTLQADNGTALVSVSAIGLR